MMKKIIDSLWGFVLYPVIWFYVHEPISILFALISAIIMYIYFVVEDKKQTKHETEKLTGEENYE